MKYVLLVLIVVTVVAAVYIEQSGDDDDSFISEGHYLSGDATAADDDDSFVSVRECTGPGSVDVKRLYSCKNDIVAVGKCLFSSLHIVAHAYGREFPNKKCTSSNGNTMLKCVVEGEAFDPREPDVKWSIWTQGPDIPIAAKVIDSCKFDSGGAATTQSGSTTSQVDAALGGASSSSKTTFKVISARGCNNRVLIEGSNVPSKVYARCGKIAKPSKCTIMSQKKDKLEALCPVSCPIGFTDFWLEDAHKKKSNKVHLTHCDRSVG